LEPQAAASPAPPRPSGSATFGAPAALRAALRGVRRRLWSWGALRALGLLVAVAGILGVPLLLLFAGAPLERWLRLSLAAGLIAALLAGLVRELLALVHLSRPDQLARLLERAAPELGDRVTTSVQLQRALPPGASAELARAHVERTSAALLDPMPVRRTTLLLWRSARPSLVVGLFGALVLTASCLTLPDALARGIVSLWPTEDALASPELLPPLVTDISLTYRYPAYLERDPRKVEGTTGEIVAPAGTEVAFSGRADRSVERAAILVGDQRLSLRVTPPDRIEGRVMVTEESRYRFTLVSDGRELTEREGHAIHLEVDAAPEVRLLEPAEDLVVKEADSVELAYRVSDDFGLATAHLVVVNLRGGEPVRRQLERVDARVTTLSGRTSLNLAVLRAEPGDRIAVHVEAEDNDTVSGPKVGRSEVRVLKIFSAAEHHEALLEQLQQLFDQLVGVLADELESPFDAEPDDVAIARAQLARARETSSRARDTLTALAELVRAFRDDALAPRGLLRALVYVHGDLRKLHDERTALFGALESYFEVAERYQLGYANRLRSGQAPFVAALERHVLYLADLLQRERLAAARLLAGELEATEARLADLLTAYRESGDEAARKQILDELDHLQRKMGELMQRLARLRRGVSDEYVNPEALTDRDLPGAFDQLRDLIAEGKVDEALRALDQLRALTQGLEDDMAEAEAGFGGEAYAELRKRLGELRSELDDLEAAQRGMVEENERRYRKEVEALRREAGESVGRLAARLQREARRALERLDAVASDALESYELSYLSEARERVDETERALGVENLEGARESALRALPPLSGLGSSLERRSRGWAAERSPQAAQARRHSSDAAERVGRIVAELDRMFPTPDRLRDPATLRALRQQARSQRSLRRRLERVQGEMQELAQEVPLFGEEHEDLLRQSGSEMGRAAQDLQAREMSGAAGHQREALAKLSEFRRSMEEMGSGSGGAGMGMPFPWGQVGGSGEGTGGGFRQERVEIPGADAYRAPDAFRRDILEAMKEPAPTGFREQVRRYYEELVK